MRKPRKAPTRKPRADGRVKSTVLITAEINFILTCVAKSHNPPLDRSTLANQLLEQGLKRFAVYDALKGFAPSAEGGSTPGAAA